MAQQDRFAQVFRDNPLPMCVTRKADGVVLDANERLLSALGFTREIILNRSLPELGIMPTALRRELVKGMPASGLHGQFDLPLRTRTNEIKLMMVYTQPMMLDGVECLVSTFVDVTEARKSEALIRGQSQVMESITADAPLEDTLSLLVRVMEAHTEGLSGSILLLSEDGLHLRHGAAPSLPRAYIDAIETLPIGPRAGSCGTAMFTGKTVIVTDISTDPLWEEYKRYAEPYGLKACWSTPIRSKDGTVLGSFAMYYREVRGPSPEEFELVGIAIHLAGIAIERKRTQEALARSENKYRILYSESPAILHSIDSQGSIVSVSEGWLRALGYSRDEVLGRKSSDFLTPESRKYAEEVVLPDYYRTGSCKDIPYQYVRKDGKILEMLLSAIAERDEAGNYIRSMAVMTDVTLRNKAVNALASSEERFRSMVENISEVFFTTDNEGVLTYVSPAIESITGLSAVEVMGRHFRELLHTDDAAQLSGALPGDAGNPSEPLEARILTKSGKPKWLRCSTRPAFRDGKPDGLRGVMMDIDSRKRAEDEALKVTLLLQSIIDTSQALIYVKDMDGRYRLANRKFQEVHGLIGQAILGRTDYELFGKERAVSLRRMDQMAVLHGQSLKSEETRTLEDGEHVYMTDRTPLRDQRGKTYAVCGMSSDVTEFKRVEEQLRQSQKTEAIGRLAGGIAHDFNNLLTAINGYSSLALAVTEPASPVHGFLQEVLKGGEKAAALTKQLLAYSRKQILDPSILNLNDVVKDMEPMLHRLIGEDIVLESDLAQDLAQVKADRGQIGQILLNLVINARDAMAGGGKVTIETSNAELDAASAKDAEVAPGTFARLSVKDTGVGMTSDVKARIYEPFFTTKGPGKGTGLGLPVVFGIVKQSEGGITVDSEPGKGTSFNILLPKAKSRESAQAPARKAPDNVHPTGTEGILLVEDDSSVRQFASIALKSLGYRVETAMNGLDALHILKEEDAKLQLIITDLVMPEMGGKELAAEVKRMHPEIPILFISGYDKSAPKDAQEFGGDSFLQKPFTHGELAEKVRRVLDLTERHATA
jgi:PAS domain S-box-containing protein